MMRSRGAKIHCHLKEIETAAQGEPSRDRRRRNIANARGPWIFAGAGAVFLSIGRRIRPELKRDCCDNGAVGWPIGVFGIRI